VLVLKLLRFIFEAPLLLVLCSRKRPRRQKKPEQAPLLQNKGAYIKTTTSDEPCSYRNKADKDEG